MIGYIYCYTNKINGKKYIGQTTQNIELRAGKDGHGYDTRFKFGKAIKKYGWDKFEVTILEKIESEDILELYNKLNELEIYYIKFFDTFKYGYNSNEGGGGNTREVTQSTKEKISKTLKSMNLGRTMYEDTLLKQSQSLKGHVVKDESRIKASKTQIDRQTHWYTNGVNNLLLDKNAIIPQGFYRGRTLSEEQAQANRVRTIGRKMPEDEKVRRSESRKKFFKEHPDFKILSKGKKKRMETLNLIEKLYTFCSELKNHSSRNDKLNILLQYKNDEEIKTFLNYVFNPYITYGLKAAKLSVDMTERFKEYNNCSYTLFELFEYLRIHNTGTYEGVWKAKCFINMYPQYKDFLIECITKSLTLGVDVLSINKCMGNFIPTFSVQLACKYFETPEYVEGKQFALTRKIDGSRIIAIKENNEVKFYTRQGQLYEGLVDLEKEMLETMPDNICLDGELTILNPYTVELDEEGRPAVGIKLTSKEQYKACMKISRKDGIKHGLKMLVFDCMKVEEFKEQVCNTAYKNRRKMLAQIFRNALTYEITDYNNNTLNNANHTYFEMLPILYEGNDTSKITEILNEQVAKGEEGIMINIVDAPYHFTRNKDLLKCKLMQDVDLEVVDYEEGSGNFTGMLGALLVRYKEGNIVKVGSGFSKELRQEIWKNPDSYIGKIISVQYFEETTNQQGGLSLRFPIFLDIRDDKTVADF